MRPIDLEQVLADACDELGKLEFARGARRAKLGKSRKQALLRATARTYAVHCLADEAARLHAPRLRVTRRELHQFRAKLGISTLSKQEASDALYEWSSLLKQPHTVDVDAAGDIARVTFTALHERDSEVVELLVDVRVDTTGQHTYTPIVVPGRDTRDLTSLLADTAGAQLSSAGAGAPNDMRVPAGLKPLFMWLIARYSNLAPERRSEFHAHAKRNTVVGFFYAVFILLAGCSIPAIREWLWLHVIVTPELALVDQNVSGDCVEGHPLAYVSFSNLPKKRPLTLLRNGQVLESYTADADTLSLTDPRVLPGTTNVYRVGVRDTWSGKYIVSPSAVAYVPSCAGAAPIVDRIEAAPREGDAPLTVTFTAHVHDPDGDPLRYTWSFGDGEAKTTDEASITHVFPYAGDWPVSGRVTNRHGGEASLNAAPHIKVLHGPLPPVLSQVELYRQYGNGKVTPSAGPPGTVFHFRAFPRRSTRGAAPVSYQWTDDKCREAAIVRAATHTPLPQRVCTSPDLGSPEYNRRIDAAGQYTFSVNIRYADGQQESLPVAVVNVGVREYLFRLATGEPGHAIKPVPAGSHDYSPITEDSAPATSSEH
jgi:hypothetical protein